MTKTCTKCEVPLPLASFSRDKTKRDGLYPSCKACRLTYGEAHRADLRAYNVRWRAEHPDRMDAAVRRWQENNRERALGIARQWKRDNWDRVLAYKRLRGSEDAHRRRARQVGSGGSYTTAEWLALCAAYGNRCLACGAAGPLTVDHIVPLASGGGNDIGNIQPLCGTCNCSKGTKTIDYRPQTPEGAYANA
jgi:5-methylcytosine-specific restriction endonuclease McrA